MSDHVTNYVKVVGGNNRIIGLECCSDEAAYDTLEKAEAVARRHIDPDAHAVLWKIPDYEAIEFERARSTCPCPPGRHRFLDSETRARVCIRCGQMDVTGVVLHAA